MNLRRLGIALAVGALMVTMIPGVAAAKQTPEEKCLDQAAKLGYVAGDFDAVYVGTNGSDTTYQPGSVSSFSNSDAELVCGFNGDDAVEGLREGDVFIGGNGEDSVTYMSDGAKFIGGNGNDFVQTAEFNATIDGGNGDDSADYVGYGATFNGGKGDDAVGWVYGSTFNGEKGDDCVGLLSGVLFDGGKGYDQAAAYGSGSEPNVEVADGGLCRLTAI